MKLFLASSADKILHLLADQVSAMGKRVLFVANAANPYPAAHRFWVDWDRKKFNELGYELSEVDLRDTTPEDLERLLRENDTLHMCGGSVYYLVDLLRSKGLEAVIIKAIREETVIYTGTSAGSVIVSKNIRPFSYDEEERDHVAKVPDHRGLGIVSFGIMPHSNNPDYAKENREIVTHMQDDPTALFFIHDHQAIWVENGSMKFLEAQ